MINYKKKCIEIIIGMSAYDLITLFLLLVSKNSILICWNVHLEDYFEGWIWLKDIIPLYSLFISLSIINIYISMYMFFCKYLFKIINHSLLYIESSTFSNQDKIFDINLKQKWFMSKYDMIQNKIRLPPVLCGCEVDVS